MRTSITELFGIEAPIVLSGMGWVTNPELAGAVSGAGGLGLMSISALSEEESRSGIRRIREITDRPFGVAISLTVRGPAFINAQVAIEEQVPVLNIQLGRAKEMKQLIDMVHAYGGKAISTVTSVRHALSAEKLGADALIVTGHEAAAHGEHITSLVLTRAVAKAVKIPIISAGGFADGHGVAAALALGAGAAAMGTRFASSIESSAHQNVKNAIIEKRADETIYSKEFDGMWARVMKAPGGIKATEQPIGILQAAMHSIKMARARGKPLFPVLKQIIQNPEQVRMLALLGAAIPTCEKATLDGDLENGVQFIGQSQGLVEDIRPAADILRDVLAETEEVIDTLAQSRN